MAGAGVSLGGLGLILAGGVLAWSGVNDPQGGPTQVVRDLLTGKQPTPGIQKYTSPLASQPISEAGLRLGQAGIDLANAGVDPRLQAIKDSRAISGTSSSGSGARVVAVAQSYLGVMYRMGGASRSGIDCSGLVLVAYRDGAGISLPHFATSQMARGKRIPREQVQPGDLVGWGVPGNYPHIALATGYDQVIVASDWGQPVKYQKLWEKKVPGFGYPDIVRIL